jgi:hypothetical protein
MSKLRLFDSVEKKPKGLKVDKWRRTVSERVFRETAAEEAKTETGLWNQDEE